MSTTDSPDVGATDPISAALTAMIDAGVTFNKVRRSIAEGIMAACIHMNECNSGRQRIMNAIMAYFKTHSSQVGYKISQFQAWISNSSADIMFNNESECVNQDEPDSDSQSVFQKKLFAFVCMNMRNLDRLHVMDALDAYLATNPERENYEIFQFQKWICNISDKATSDYIDISRRGADALDAANASLQAATKVYEALGTQKQVYEEQLADTTTSTPIQ